MATLTANPDILIVDVEAGETNKNTEIKYEKERHEVLWERRSSGTSVGNWSSIDPQFETGLGDVADQSASYIRTLVPRDKYEVRIYPENQNPNQSEIRPLASLTVYCLLKKPENRNLITDENREFGGTWYLHQVATNVPTEIVLIGASRTPPNIDDAGIPHLVNPDGAPSTPLTLSTNHIIDVDPLFPGNHYYAVVVVTDRFGNWDVRQWEFTALRRKLTVEFPTIHIYNDGDPGGYGKAEFWFRVYTGPRNSPTLLQPQDFHLPYQDIDDWSETDRPYAVGFAHVGQPQIVSPDERRVAVSSWGTEEDGFLEPDEGAAGDRAIILPTGRFSEQVVVPRTFTMDCSPSTTGDDFHYGVDVRWSVTYVP